jgi:hypothetical protein
MDADFKRNGPFKPQPPTLTVGDTPNEWTVIAVLGHGKEHPESGKVYNHGYWWYEARCSCGRKVVLRQTQLASKKAKKHCNECERQAQRERDTTAKDKPTNTIPPELDFARMKLRVEEDSPA